MLNIFKKNENKFEIISLQQFILDYAKSIGSEFKTIEEIPNELFNVAFYIYNELKLPQRATDGSAGYDLYTPFSFTLAPNDEIAIPTGICVSLDKNKWLDVRPRSGLGFKYYLRLANTCPVIDADYFYSDNEGHIWIKIRNEGNKTFSVTQGDGFVQGIISDFYRTSDDKAHKKIKRNGGFGSTSKSKNN